jgi:tetratricopeptide (TPR) repeat protein
VTNSCHELRERFLGAGLAAHDSEWRSHLVTCAECRCLDSAVPVFDEFLDRLGQQPIPPPSFDSLRAPAAQIARRRRRAMVLKRSWPFVTTGLAAAAVATVVLLVVGLARDPWRSAKRLHQGDELRADREANHAVLTNGARIRLEMGSLRILPDDLKGELIHMASGHLHLEVPKMGGSGALVVHTPDAEVIVHGTRFEVFSSPQQTQVHVTEGLVEVRPEGIGRPARFLRPGESISVTSSEAYRETIRRSLLDMIEHGQSGDAEKEIQRIVGADATALQRAEAQTLLAWAMAARGQREQALKNYREALSLLPPATDRLWSQNACAEMAFLYERDSVAMATWAWNECLRRFPRGLHAELARSRLSRLPASR